MLNIGSYGHETGQCRPCNKFNINNSNSCKHGITCNFCHNPTHEKPKHRGQRGRFAILNRKFKEQYHMYPEWYQNLVTNIYAIPNEILRDLKSHLYLIEDINIRSELTKNISIIITNIGCLAHTKRYDIEHNMSNHYTPQPKIVVADLDGRIKWFQGTLHQTINKMMDKKIDDKNEIINYINKILKMIKKLPKLIINEKNINNIFNYYNNYDKNNFEWIYEIINELNIDYYCYDNIIFIENIISRIINISEFNEIQFKNIIIDNKITNINTLIEYIEIYYNKIIDNLFEKIDNNFNELLCQ